MATTLPAKQSTKLAMPDWKAEGPSALICNGQWATSVTSRRKYLCQDRLLV